ncbi:MAG TPA: hypothetical protein VGK01_23085, partial [Candidatus Angelobacter sp.]
LADLAQRYSMQGTFKDPRDLDRHLAVVEEKKRLLTDYASLINKTTTVPISQDSFLLSQKTLELRGLSAVPARAGYPSSRLTVLSNLAGRS